MKFSFIFTLLLTVVAAKKDDSYDENYGGTMGNTASTSGNAMGGSSSGGTMGGSSAAEGNIAEVASSLPDFSTLVQLVTLDDPAIQPVLERITGTTPTTVFAPTNAAFAALPTSAVTFLQNNPSVLAEVLLYHAVDGSVPSSAIGTDPLPVQTLGGEQLVAQRINDGVEKVMINKSVVEIVDVPATNGVIHAIDKVLLPPSLALLDIVDTAVYQNLNTLAKAVTEANLVQALKSEGPFTVFAPSEEAWAGLPAGLIETLLLPENQSLLVNILQYHVIAGSAVDAASIVSGTDVEMLNGGNVRLVVTGNGVTVNGANVITADVRATNGIIHVIDKILIPPGVDVPKDIVELASADPDLSSLVNALVEADLVSALDVAGPFTVLAPTNAAFAALGDTSLDVETLKNVLLYHVISGNFLAADVVTLSSAKTLNGQSVSIRVEGGNVFVGEAQVIVTDIIASNGVIHKIDAVLMPPPPPPPRTCRYSEIICYALELMFGP